MEEWTSKSVFMTNLRLNIKCNEKKCFKKCVHFAANDLSFFPLWIITWCWAGCTEKCRDQLQLFTAQVDLKWTNLINSGHSWKDQLLLWLKSNDEVVKLMPRILWNKRTDRVISALFRFTLGTLHGLWCLFTPPAFVLPVLVAVACYPAMWLRQGW